MGPGIKPHLLAAITSSVAILPLLSPTAIAEEMTFEMNQMGRMGMWIVAEGKISDDTAAELERRLNLEFSFAKESAEYDVYLNSSGGSLRGGIAFGRFFRKQNFSTYVNRTCASACAYAFLGGVEREAQGGTLGVHQFKHTEYEKRFAPDLSDQQKRSSDSIENQRWSAVLIEYVFQMGVDPRFLQLASEISPDDIYYLSSEELNQYDVNWQPKTFQPWAIKPSGRDVIAFSNTKDKTQTAELFCRQEKVPIFTIKLGSNESQWYQDAIDNVESMGALGRSVPKSAITLKVQNGRPIIELSLPNFDPEQLDGKWIGTGANGPRYLLSGFTFELPLKNAKQTMSIALRNCI